MSNERYLPDHTYDTLVSAILRAEPCAFSGTVTEDQIKIALGEVSDIWPARIKEDHRNET